MNLLGCICSLLFLMSGLFLLYSIVLNCQLMGEVHGVSDTIVSSHQGSRYMAWGRVGLSYRATPFGWVGSADPSLPSKQDVLKLLGV